VKSATVVVTMALLANAGSLWAQGAAPTRESQVRRQQIQMMEGVLTQAVRNGATALGQRIAEPGSVFVTGTARARGFVLDGYGVFFDVDVPAMRQSFVWSAMVLKQRKLELQQLIAQTPDGPTRQQMIAEMRRLDPTFRADGQQAGPSNVSQAAAPGSVSAQTVAEAAAVDSGDPSVQYTDAVKSALIDAMLDYTGLNLGPDEWLTVAARDSEGPMMPNVLEDKSSIILRVRGRDLIAYQARQITREEARKRVEVKEF
jgi:hypothetical protein